MGVGGGNRHISTSKELWGPLCKNLRAVRTAVQMHVKFCIMCSHQDRFHFTRSLNTLSVVHSVMIEVDHRVVVTRDIDVEVD